MRPSRLRLRSSLYVTYQYTSHAVLDAHANLIISRGFRKFFPVISYTPRESPEDQYLRNAKNLPIPRPLPEWEGEKDF